MASPLRTARSGATPDRRRPDSRERPTRPQLTLVEGGRHPGNALAQGADRVIAWTRTRSTPLIHVVVAIVFLSVCLIGSLLLRTEMVQNSFQATQVQTSISDLTQDVQDDQNALDQLRASLPDKAQEMGMVPQQGLTSIDLKGYQPPAQGDAKGGR